MFNYVIAGSISDIRASLPFFGQCTFLILTDTICRFSCFFTWYQSVMEGSIHWTKISYSKSLRATANWSVNQVLKFVYIPTGIYIFKLNSGNTKTSCEIYSNLINKDNRTKYSNVALMYLLQKQPPRGALRKRCSENMRQIYKRTRMPKQLYWNHTSSWVFACKFAAYFQNTFF